MQQSSLPGIEENTLEYVTCNNTSCGRYGYGDVVYTLKLVKKGLNYEPMVKVTCDYCGKYIKFAKQTPELMEKINGHLQNMRLKFD